ncbi:MAG TPA: penicillin acylase family protein [Propionibacteriaceae bacterium]|nr:penicillin acylase family protein [Propionibacteriaceae bacterium]
MRHTPRWLVFTALVVVLVLAGLSSLVLGTVRSPLPVTEGRVVLPGLGRSVEVLRDDFGVPQIYADTAEDLFEAQGYVHAQDRFYEMDVRRHTTAGRLSELFGASQVPTDAYIRTLGWRRVAEQELPLLSSSTRRYLDAYASGVNSYLRSRSASDISLEYSLLDIRLPRYTPQEWTAADSVSWIKAMAWDLGGNLHQETEQSLVAAKLGAARAASLEPGYPLHGFEPIVTRGAVAGGLFDPGATRSGARPAPAALGRDQVRQASSVLAAAAKVSAAIPALIGSRTRGAETGSNSWVVSGQRTASGKPMLSNDPHLATSIPSTFAQVGLHCRTRTAACPFDVSGFSFAGMPGVVIGHNADIAWGLTTSHVDVQDLYLEDVRGDTVRIGNSYRPLQVRTEEIRVAGEDKPRTITVRSSRHGPLLSDVDPQLQGLRAGAPYAAALSWVALTPGRTMDALFGFGRAANFAEFRAAAKLLSAPSQNLVYADTKGNIGYQLPGDIPIRQRGDGRLPVPGWDPTYDWAGKIPFAQLPYVYNPPRGYIVTANQQVIGSQYAPVLGSDYSYGWRSQEIIDQLKDAPPLTPDTAEQLFYDDTIRFAADIVPTLLKIRVRDSWVREGQQTLVGWDYSSAPDSAAAAYFNVVMHNLLKLTFRDELPTDLWPTGGDRWYAVVSKLLATPDDPWWDDVTTKDRRERRDDILLAAMTGARKEITSLMARDTDEWQWGKLHRVTLRNQTLGSSGNPVLERIFNRGDFPVGGGSAVVNAMGYDTTEGYHVTSGPTMRMLVDLGGWDTGRWVNQSGVSGHAFASHYDDQTTLWASNRTWPFVFSRSAVDGRTQERLELVPAG